MTRADSAPTPLTAPRAGTISRRRIERFIVSGLALFGLLFGAQSVPAMIADLPYLRYGLTIIAELVILCALVAFGVCVVAGRYVRVAAAAFAAAYAIVLLAWPLYVDSPDGLLPSVPWVWYLLTVATTSAAVALPAAGAALYTVVVPLIYGVIRALPSGGAVGVEDAAIDAAYGIILGGVIVIIIFLLRQSAVTVDLAQETALAGYTTAVREHAAEAERLQVDALVHDSVLTTFLVAANAQTQAEKRRAAGMAKAALGHLEAASRDTGQAGRSVTLHELADRLQHAAGQFTRPVQVRVQVTTAQAVPAEVADALHDAAVQALVNSVQHAGDETVLRELIIADRRPTAGVRVEVRDDGAGFAPEAIPVERLGVRVSIRERIASIGGSAEVVSQQGRGTRVVLAWPRAEEER